MKAYHHLLSSILIGFILHFYIDGTEMIFSLISAMFFGVLIDIDHIPLSRFYYGDWRNLKEISKNIVKAYTGEIEIEWFPVWMRYITHSIFVGGLGTVYFFTGSVYILIGLISSAFHLLTEPVYDYLNRGGFS